MIARASRSAATAHVNQSKLARKRVFDEGHGVAQDTAEAIRWYRLAAAQGYARSQTRLALLGA